MALVSRAAQAFSEFIHPQILLAQVSITARHHGAYELRHVADQTTDPATLQELTLSDLRDWVQSNAAGQFRPLKSAPDLRPGWIFRAPDLQALEQACQILYPGALADWHAWHTQTAHPTDYRPFTNRQTGIYRITQLLDDQQAARAIQSCCHSSFCLKRRFWSVTGLATDENNPGKSAIPCLEPCAILLEFSRKAMRIEQEDPHPLTLTPSDRSVVESALLRAAANPPSDLRVADFNSPENPRRCQLVLEKLRAQAP